MALAFAPWSALSGLMTPLHTHTLAHTLTASVKFLNLKERKKENQDDGQVYNTQKYIFPYLVQWKEQMSFLLPKFI